MARAVLARARRTDNSRCNLMTGASRSNPVLKSGSLGTWRFALYTGALIVAALGSGVAFAGSNARPVGLAGPIGQTTPTNTLTPTTTGTPTYSPTVSNTPTVTFT